jgi:hypothetical protein
LNQRSTRLDKGSLWSGAVLTPDRKAKRAVAAPRANLTGFKHLSRKVPVNRDETVGFGRSKQIKTAPKGLLIDQSVQRIPSNKRVALLRHDVTGSVVKNEIKVCQRVRGVWTDEWKLSLNCQEIIYPSVNSDFHGDR